MTPTGKLYRTLRHLRASQLYFQCLRRVQRQFSSATPRVFSGSAAPALRWSEGIELLAPAGKDACRDWDSKTFSFINREKALGNPVPWEGAGLGKLWDYNLHYFEWLWGLESERAKEAVSSWIAECPFSRDAVGWEPYPLSLRVMNWVGFWGTKGRATLVTDGEFATRLWQSLAAQCDWLTRRLEKHLLGNHYLENGAALWIVGSFYEGSLARRWAEKGKNILERELTEQILPGGIHFERSPMYHNRLVFVLSWLASIERDLGEARQFHSLIETTRAAAEKLTHPDGKIALLNDSAFGIYPEMGASGDRGERSGSAILPLPSGNERPNAASTPLPLGAFALPDAGYYGSRTARGDYLLCDAGRVGPDYLPGHAHCDVLSFELSIGGERFLTDTGVLTYENNADRHYLRSTAAHNTFGPVDYEQAEIWSAFRVGRRPDVDVKEWVASAGGDFVLSATHNGFETGQLVPARHTRTFRFEPHGRLTIEETFSANKEVDWEGRLHFHPSVIIQEQRGDDLRLQHAGRTVKLSFTGIDSIETTQSPYYERFNIVQERLCVKYRTRSTEGKITVVLDWSEGEPRF